MALVRADTEFIPTVLGSASSTTRGAFRRRKRLRATHGRPYKPSHSIYYSIRSRAGRAPPLQEVFDTLTRPRYPIFSRRWRCL